MDQAAGTFQQALELHPSFAAAALGLAWVYEFKAEEAWDPPSVAFERARQAADLAIKQAMDLGGGVDATHEHFGRNAIRP